MIDVDYMIEADEDPEVTRANAQKIDDAIADEEAAVRAPIDPSGTADTPDLQ